VRRRRGDFRPATDEELDRLSEYSESDKQRARLAAELDGGPRFAALLDAEPVKLKKGRRRG
jgi:hypothetical protein